MPAAVGEFAADESLDPIHARLTDVDGVAQPFAAFEIVDDVPGGVPRRGDDVHVHVGPILPALISRSQVVIGDAFAAVVEVFSLYQPRHGERRARERRSMLPRNSNCVQVEVLLLGDDAQDVPACGQAHAVLAKPLEGTPRTGVGYGDWPGDV